MRDILRRDEVVVAVWVHTCTPHQAHHTLLPVAIFPQARSFVCSFFPFPGMRVFSCYARIRFLLSQATTSALPVKPVATTVAEPHVSSVPVVTCVAPVPVIECVTPSSDGQYVAPALRICSASTSARGRGTCTCEEVLGTCTSSDLRDARAVPCRVHHGSRHDRRKPGHHVLGRFNSSPSRLLRCRDTRMSCTYCARWIHNSLLLRLKRLHSRSLDPYHFCRSSVVCTTGSQVRWEQVVAGGTSKNIVESQQSNSAGAGGCTRNA